MKFQMQVILVQMHNKSISSNSKMKVNVQQEHISIYQCWFSRKSNLSNSKSGSDSSETITNKFDWLYNIRTKYFRKKKEKQQILQEQLNDLDKDALSSGKQKTRQS